MAQLELKLAREVKNKKVFLRYMSSKQNHREDIGPLLNRAGKLVSNNADNAEVLNGFFASVLTSIAGPQITGSSSYNACVNPPVMKGWSVASCKGSTHINLWAQTESTPGC